MGIVEERAPNWNIQEWAQLPEGVTRLDISDFQGKILYLFCFQSACPGCHSYGFPALQELMTHYRSNTHVAFVAVQTVFENFSLNTFDKAQEAALKYELSMPVGQSGDETKPSQLMRSYRTGGTPWFVITDPNGIVRANDFRIEAKTAIQIIDSCLQYHQMAQQHE